MKRFIKNICCLALVATMFSSSITVYAYTSAELSKIRQSEEAMVLYSLGNEDLEYYVSKSAAESTNASNVSYKTENEYKIAGAEAGRRSGITEGIDDYYETKFPSEDNAKKTLEKISDETILKENKIALTDTNKQVFIDAYRANYLDAYNIAEYELAGYFFGKLKAESDLVRNQSYPKAPSLEESFALAEKLIFTSYNVKSTDAYGMYFEEAYTKAYEVTYVTIDETPEVAYTYGKLKGYETAERINNELVAGESFSTKMDEYKKSSAYKSERSKFILGLSANNTNGLNEKYDDGFNAGVEEYSVEVLGGSTSGESGEAGETGTSLIYQSGLNDGQTVGKQVAEVYAKNYFINHKAYDVDAAYNDYINTVDFTVNYRLNLLPKDYSDGFLAGVKEGFYSAYEETYLLMQSNIAVISKTVQLPTQGDLTAEYIVEAPSTDLSVSFSLDFGYGNFFDESFVKVYDTGRFWEHDSTRYTAYSNAYKVEVYNNSTGVRQDYITLKQPMNITFTHDLGENVGVYKVVGSQLRYIHTEVDNVDGTTVFATIPAGKYYGGTYVLLADEKLPKVKDIANNWNYSGLDTYSRRGWLPTTSDGYAKPENNITRAQFAFMLERNANKYNEVVAKPVNYADENKFYGYNNAINYCVSKGYMTVDSENRFRPQDTISYAEVETILQRALGYSVPFSTVDKKMQTLNFHKSKYATNKKSPITISETVFTLLDIYQ